MKTAYMPRIVDTYMDFSLEASGAVLIEGAKWCGKTRTGEEKAKSVLYMQDPDKAESYIGLADTKPSLLLRGDKPRLIDEWQMAPVLWDAVRHAVDRSGESGQFILTGSAVPADNVVKHTGTGRISRMTMRPMSLYESGESTGSISLKALFDGIEEVEDYSQLDIEDIAFCVVRGGWPGSMGKSSNIAVKIARDYVDAVINQDVSRVDNVTKNPARVRVLMRSYARNIGTMASIATIRSDMAGDETTITENTITSYINALRRLFVIEDLHAWNPSLRSKTAIRTSAKRFFVDPSIAAAVMRLTPESILNDFNTFGFLFEALCLRDLRVYAQVLDGEVFHYRDKSNLEADMIISLNDGRWGAVEVKLGGGEIESAAKNLLKLKDRVDVKKMFSPSFLMILTGSGYAYKRDDGVLIVPIGCLKD